MGESMVSIQKIVDEKISKFKKKEFFTKTQESRFKFYLNFILNLLNLQLGLL